MIGPDDSRHGTTAGYTRGCREACCRRARRLHETERRRALDRGITLTVPSLASVRRVQALMRLGWTSQDIADVCGWQSGNAVTLIPRRPRVRKATAEAITRAYGQLSMKVGPSDTTRNRAARAGWPPPLAWDDERIGDPDYQPVMRPEGSRIREMDPVVVERILTGERMDATPAEKAEVIRRWRASGRSLNDLERLTGINPHRGYREAV